MLKPITIVLFGGIVAVIIGSTAFARAPRGVNTLQGLGDGEIENRKFDRSLSASGAKNVVIRVPIGEVHLSSIRGGRLLIHAERSCRTPSAPEAQRWLRDSVLKVDRQGRDLVVEDLPFGSRGSHNFHGDFGPKLVVEVSAPEGIDVELDMQFGSVQGGGRFGGLQGRIQAGSYEFKGLECTGAVKLHAGAGSVEADFGSPIQRDSRIDVGAGSMEIGLPKGTNMDVRADVGVGLISGLPASPVKSNRVHVGDHRTAKIGRGGSKLQLHAGVGNIELTSHETVASSAQSADPADREESNEPGEPDENYLDTSNMDLPNEKMIDEEMARSMKEAKVETERAMKEANREIREAMAEVERELGSGNLKSGKHGSGSDFGMDEQDLRNMIRQIVRAALESARAAVEASRHSLPPRNP